MENAPLQPILHPQRFKIILIIVAFVLAIGAAFGGFKLAQKLAGNEQSNPVDIEAQKAKEFAALDKELAAARATDADMDGLSDAQEKQLGTDPGKPDTDGDGILDKAEIEIWKTDPLKPDTDNDGFKDGYEIRRGFSPLGEGELKKN